MMGDLMAAFGKVCMTPEEPVSLQGYNPDVFIADPSKDLLDDIFARILLLDNGSERFVIISVDCCLSNEKTVLVCDGDGKPEQYREFNSTFPEGTRESWARTAGIESSYISMVSTHTHTAPVHFQKKYTDRICDYRSIRFHYQMLPRNCRPYHVE